MKSRILFILLFAAQGLLWSCAKTVAPCSGSLKPIVGTNEPVVAGDTLQLFVRGIGDVNMYNWYGPNDFSSHDSLVQIPSATSANSGVYHVDVITNTGCIYSGASDSVLLGPLTLPCSLANNYASISGVEDMSFYYVGGSASGGYWQISGYGDNGDVSIQFVGSAPPPAGVYTAVSQNGDDLRMGQCYLSFNDGFNQWYATGTVYVTASSGNTVTVGACSLHLSGGGYTTTGSLQVTAN